MSGIFPTISITANRTIEATPISLKLNPLLHEPESICCIIFSIYFCKSTYSFCNKTQHLINSQCFLYNVQAMVQRLILFLTLNFGALALGGIFAGQGAVSDWYEALNKAPWTPPGWVFGFAWTTIMICYSLFMTLAWEKVNMIEKNSCCFYSSFNGF